MQQCEFEEKQYEQLMNIELAKKGQVYPSGQFLEHDIAVDAAVFYGNPVFWHMWRTQRKLMVKPGLYLRKEFWEIAERELKSNMFPKFKCNLFIQYKRPESVSSPHGTGYSHWKEPYLRYEINQYQQDILHKLERRVSAYSIVAYACPCFLTREELWRFMNGKLVENSNFVKAHKLQGHQRYTFVKAGKDGYACSEPSRVEGIDILKEIRRAIEEPTRFENNVQFLNGLAKDIKMVAEELGERAKGFYAIRENIGSPEHELGSSIITILAFNLFANTAWGIGCETTETPVSPDYDLDARLKAFVKNW